MADSQTGPAPFRVILCGGGVAGLVLAHGLSRAGIDWILLEKHQVAGDNGASLNFYPHTNRVMAQLGVLEELYKYRTNYAGVVHRKSDGSDIFTFDAMLSLLERVGPHLATERGKILKTLFDTLPHQERAKSYAAVKAVHSFDDFVDVELVDGTIIHGDIAIGCDGIHSRVKESMWNEANRKQPGTITVKEKSAIRAEYKLLYGVTDSPVSIDKFSIHYGSKFSLQFLADQKRAMYGIYEKLDKPFSYPERRKYSAQDIQDFSRKYASVPVSKEVMFGEIVSNSRRLGMVSLEEGVLEHWYAGRIVLVGDSAAKVTPNLGLGACTSIDSAVELVNGLVKLLKNSPKPSTAQLETIFHAYQEKQKPKAHEVVKVGGEATRMQAWDTSMLKFLVLWMLPYIDLEKTMLPPIENIVKAGNKFDFIDVPEMPPHIPAFGKVVPFDDEVAFKKEEKTSSGPTMATSLAILVGGVALAAGARVLLSRR